MKRAVSTDAAPAAVGAYSQATATDDLPFTAGQLPLTADGELLDDDPPARSAVEVGAVPKGAALEVEAVAAME